MEFKVAGVTFENRQDIIRGLLGLSHDARGIYLEAEPNNEYDQNAVAVYCANGKIGYVPRVSQHTIAKSTKIISHSKIIGNEIFGIILRVQ